jgi:DNA-directed RNA polymerase subunit K/omega
MSAMNTLSKRSNSSVAPLVETRDVVAMKEKTGNLYESIAVISRRANQININIKEELHRRLDEFNTIIGDNLEEINENKEQIEVSRVYERMANPALQATNEFLNDEIYYKK